MNINHLQYFQMLAKTKNFSAAAERCYTTQPNLSYGIKALEEELGVALIERGNRRVDLTQAGEMYLPYVESALSELRQGQSMLQGWKSTVKEETVRIGGLRLKYFSGIISSLMLNETNNMISFNAFAYSFQEAERRVLDGSLEIGTGMWEPESQLPELAYIPIKLPDLVLVVDEQHPLAEYDSVNLWQIKDYRLIRKPGGSMSKEIDVLYKKAGITPIVMENAPTLMVVLGLVENRMGIALVTDTRDVDGYRVKKLRIDWPKQDFFYSIFFKKDAPLSWATRLVCTYIINENGVDPKKSLQLLHHNGTEKDV